MLYDRSVKSSADVGRRLQARAMFQQKADMLIAFPVRWPIQATNVSWSLSESGDSGSRGRGDGVSRAVVISNPRTRTLPEGVAGDRAALRDDPDDV